MDELQTIASQNRSKMVLQMPCQASQQKVDKDGDSFLTRGEFVLGSSELINKRSQLFQSLFISFHHHVMGFPSLGFPSLGKEGTQVGETPSIHQGDLHHFCCCQSFLQPAIPSCPMIKIGSLRFLPVTDRTSLARYLTITCT